MSRTIPNVTRFTVCKTPGSGCYDSNNEVAGARQRGPWALLRFSAIEALRSRESSSVHSDGTQPVGAICLVAVCSTIACGCKTRVRVGSASGVVWEALPQLSVKSLALMSATCCRVVWRPHKIQTCVIDWPSQPTVVPSAPAARKSTWWGPSQILAWHDRIKSHHWCYAGDQLHQLKGTGDQVGHGRHKWLRRHWRHLRRPGQRGQRGTLGTPAPWRASRTLQSSHKHGSHMCLWLNHWSCFIFVCLKGSVIGSAMSSPCWSLSHLLLFQSTTTRSTTWTARPSPRRHCTPSTSSRSFSCRQAALMDRSRTSITRMAETRATPLPQVMSPKSFRQFLEVLWKTSVNYTMYRENVENKLQLLKKWSNLAKLGHKAYSITRWQRSHLLRRCPTSSPRCTSTSLWKALRRTPISKMDSYKSCWFHHFVPTELSSKPGAMVVQVKRLIHQKIMELPGNWLHCFHQNEMNRESKRGVLCLETLICRIWMELCSKATKIMCWIEQERI